MNALIILPIHKFCKIIIDGIATDANSIKGRLSKCKSTKLTKFWSWLLKDLTEALKLKILFSFLLKV